MTASWRGLSLVCPACQGAIEAASGGATCRSCGAAFDEEGGVLKLLAGRCGVPGFDPHLFATLRQIEDRHFWFVARRQVVLSALRRKVSDLGSRRLFDIGCGSGGLLAFLAANGVAIAGACDAYPESLRLVRDRLDVPLVQVDEGRPLPLGAGYDLFGMFDVLEHVDDDVGTLRGLWAALSPGGVLVLTVPAHPWLFDEMDRIAFHRRRYRRGDLRKALESAGFDVRLLTHFMSPLVPALAVVRPLSRLIRRGSSGERRQEEFRVVPGVNGALKGLLALERAALRVISLPLGSSIVAVAVRRA